MDHPFRWWARWCAAAFLGCLVSCKAGQSYLELYAHFEGNGTACSNLNQFVIAADGAGNAQIRAAGAHLPVYVQVWDKAQVIVGSHDPETKMAFPRGTPLPDEAKTIVTALLTPAEITLAGLTFVTP